MLRTMIGDDDPGRPGTTDGPEYTQRLRELQGARWKTVLDVQRPYRWNLRRLGLGRCLDVGCGIGRNLRGLGPTSVGIDHNPTSVEICRSLGLVAYTPDEFLSGSAVDSSAFDSILVAHVLEHLDQGDSDGLLRDYLPYLRSGGRVVVITPQEVGQRSDPTHVRWVDHAAVREHAQRAGLDVERAYSFPFPRWVGKVFIYNEFVTVLSKP